MNTDTRTDEELEAIIAQWCGWLPSIGDHASRNAWLDLTGEDWPLMPPRYCRSLDAVHSAEKNLTPDQAWLYNRTLSEIHGTAGGMGSGVVDEWDWHSTARQRAEALVRVIEESKK